MEKQNKMIKQLLCILGFLVAVSIAGSPNRILFGPHTVIYTITNNILQVQVQANNNGWVAFGWGDSMINSDMVILRDDGTLKVEDRFSTVRGVAPSLDIAQGGTQDWTLVSGGFKNGAWDVTIQRTLTTSDNKDYQLINGKRYDTLFAIGNEMSFTQKHKFFWEYEDIKYSDEQLGDQDGAGCKLTAIFTIVFTIIFYIIM
ncbi:hypothetical protein ABPG72_012015 [Tetrahymena utriculariae]